MIKIKSLSVEPQRNVKDFLNYNFKLDSILILRSGIKVNDSRKSLNCNFGKTILPRQGQILMIKE